jgi:hypothetical protein
VLNRRESPNVPLQGLNIHLNYSSFKSLFALWPPTRVENPDVEASEENGRHTGRTQSNEKLVRPADRLTVDSLNLAVEIAEHNDSFKH